MAHIQLLYGMVTIKLNLPSNYKTEVLFSKLP